MVLGLEAGDRVVAGALCSPVEAGVREAQRCDPEQARLIARAVSPAERFLRKAS